MLNLIYFFVAKFLQKLMWNQAQLKKKHFYLRHLRISSRKKIKQKILTFYNQLFFVYNLSKKTT